MFSYTFLLLFIIKNCFHHFLFFFLIIIKFPNHYITQSETGDKKLPVELYEIQQLPEIPKIWSFPKGLWTKQSFIEFADLSVDFS